MLAADVIATMLRDLLFLVSLPSSAPVVHCGAEGRYARIFASEDKEDCQDWPPYYVSLQALAFLQLFLELTPMRRGI